MRGVMIIGIQERLGFVLHAQDLEPFAAETVPLGERALRTFELRLKKRVPSDAPKP